MQGNLLQDRGVFSSFDYEDMQKANLNLDLDLNRWQAFKLLAIVFKIKAIA